MGSCLPYFLILYPFNLRNHPVIKPLCAALCCFFFTKTIQAQVKAAFTASAVEGCAPLVVQFSDASSGVPTHWKWDLGNGTVSSQQNPGVAYTLPGTYTVKLVTGNAQGDDSVTRTAYIQVYGKPDVQFTANPLTGCQPLPVQFTDQSNPVSGTIASYTWDFGDGQISPLANPMHTYTTAGSFNISLTIKNSYGCKQVLQKNGLVQLTDKVKAGFSYVYVNACQPPAVLRFTNLSGTGASQYQWLFGDGDSSSAAAPEHTYTAAGSYSVKLVTFTATGCTDTATQLINIGSTRTGFSLLSGACTGKLLAFANTSSPQPLSSTWTFGDGQTASGINVQHSYATAGNYQVTMHADFGNCKDSVVKTIQVTDKPIAAFTASGILSSCNAPATVNFSNTSAGGQTYKWLFGDGDSAISTNASHTYQGRGAFTVTLIAINANGCSDTAVKKELVHVGPPSISGITRLPYQGCVPTIVPMVLNADATQSITAYLWNFGDGSTSTEANPVHQYVQAGVYAVSVIIQTSAGCTDTFTLQSAVQLAAPPKADFIANPLATCGSRAIQFTDQSTSGATAWQWFFGDGQTATGPNPIHGYKDTGYFTITLIASNNQCSDTLKKIDYIHIDAPIAKFQTSPQCTQPYLRQFTDKSIGAQTWHWDFGDGQTATSQSPSHTYGSPGKYMVQLIVTNSSCADTSNTQVIIADEHPVIAFTLPGGAACRNQPVQLAATQFNATMVSSFVWAFGDGAAVGPGSQYDSVSHAYSKPGSYSPALTLTDVNGCLVKAQLPAALQVFGPTAAFSNTPGNCLQRGGGVDFADQSATDGMHAITQWTWDYGDGQTASLSAAPFHHVYQAAGNYTVQLKITDAFGCTDMATGKQAVVITDPKARFAVSDSIRCSNNSITFQNQSTGQPSAYSWYFGDGQQSAQQSPVHSYAQEGVYGVALAVTDRFGCRDSLYQPAVINISNPRASFALQDTFSACPPLLVQPQNTSTQITSLHWDFNDGTVSGLTAPQHAYTQGGIFKLLLVVKGYGNCYAVASKQIVVKGPSGHFTYTPPFGCSPAAVAFKASVKNTANMIWDFSDGNTLSTKDSLLSHTYLDFGAYKPRLVLIDSSNCRVSTENPDTIYVGGTKAGIKIIPATGCDSSLIRFADSSVAYYDQPARYRWDFGDHSAAGSANTEHYYTRQGRYNIKLVVTTQQGCTDSITQPVMVQVHKSPQVNIQAPDSVCLHTPVQFTGADMAPDTVITAWNWDYGNGASGKTHQPVYTYPGDGKYTATLIAVNAYGCADTARHPLTVLPLPKLDAGVDTVLCKGQSLVLHPSGADTYLWRSVSSLSCTDCANPLATPLVSTRYYVQGSSAFGCKARDSLLVEVKQPTYLAVAKADTLCAGESVQLNAGGAEQYLWQPATGLSNPAIANPIASPQTTTVYQLVGGDAKHCFTDTAKITIKVYPIPVFHILDSVRTMNVGSADTLHTSNSPDIVRWQWTPPYGLSCANCPEPVAMPRNSMNYMARAFNEGGCSSTSKVTIQVLCNGVNVFMPNTFSPNHDGMNDRFYPRGKGLFVVKSLRIFNRWGQEVFVKLNFAANAAADGWDGTFQGQDATAGVYVYIMEVICENNTVVSMKGNIALLR